MNAQPKIASIAHLIADPARAAMLMALADDRARPAGELAREAGVTAQTASSHLGKLLAGGLLAVEVEGRHRYYRLASAQVALAIEHLATLDRGDAVPRKPASGQAARDLQFARCCYDHLAGRVGVAVAHAMEERDYLIAAEDKRYAVTRAGVDWFERMGLDIPMLKPTRRGLARQCLDWTERQHHLAGPLGVQFMALLCSKGWLRRHKHSRAVQVTPQGWIGLKQHLGIDLEVAAFKA